ncbi:MAG: hypothetical protein ACTSX8_10630 [Alphaproteobacteria bacterium]
MAFDNTCGDCGDAISDDYDRCYDCNTNHREAQSDELKIKAFEIVAETDKARLVRFEDGLLGEKAWLPKSQTTLDGDYVYVPKWLAEEKEIDGFAV